MLNEEFLTSLLGNEEVSADDKIKQIIAEHEADTRGLLQKRDELLGNEVKLKEQIRGYEAKGGEYASKIKSLEDLLAQANAGDKKAEEYYNTKLAEMQKDYDAKLKEVTDSRDYYHQKHIDSLEDKAFENGLKDLTFVPGLKEGFVARIRSLNDFEPTDIEGQIKFLNKEHRTIEEVIRAFALTPEGKAYIANPSTGGGARGSTVTTSNEKTITREQLNEMQRNDPKAAAEFFAKGGRITA